MIDTHCHLTFEGLIEQVDDVLSRAAAAGVDRMISVGTTPADAQRALDLSTRYEQVFATVGVHPGYADRVTDMDAIADDYRRLIAHPRVVAFGEIGLDRHWSDPPFDLQRRTFAWQLEFVNQLDAQGPAAGGGKPIIIHNRKATDDVIAMIRESGLPGERFVFHCFTGTRDELDKLLDLGAMVSFTGVVTFQSAQEVAACAAATPLDRLMVETDSPYLTPAPHRKVFPNEPRFVRDVARFIAARRGMDEHEFIEVMDANAKRFFRLPPPVSGGADA